MTKVGCSTSLQVLDALGIALTEGGGLQAFIVAYIC
jgi:hypothetical protein